MTYASDSNRLTTLNRSKLPVDAAGNHTQVNNLRITYDNQGRLSEVYQASIYKVADYKYNALGQRIVKRTFDMGSQAVIGTTSYLYDQSGKLIGQTFYDEKGLKTSSQYWFWLDGMPLAQLTANFSATGGVSSSKLIYIHPDHLNTPRLATDSSQALLWQWNSDAYGLGAANEDVDGDGKATSVPLRFPGQIYDAQTQLNYNYYRDYDPATGRYVQSDPIGLQGGLNTFGYVNGNPLSYADPMGLEAFLLPSWVYSIPSVVPAVGRSLAGIGSGLGVGAACLMYPNNSIGNSECPPGGCYYTKDKTEKPKAKAGNASEGDIVRTPTTYPDNFVSAGYGDKKNTNTGEVWSPSNTNHSNSDGGEWKVGLKPGVPPRKGAKITVSDGRTIIKFDK